MNDLDQAIRSELERMVPVTSEPDWGAVALAANLGERSIRRLRRRRQAVAVALACLVVVGAAVAAVGQIPWWQRGSHPQAVIEDVYRDGKLGREWNCPSLRAAIRELPEDVVRYSNLEVPIVAASTRRCGAAMGSLRPGATEEQVRTTLGRPDETRRTCWLYAWKPLPLGTIRLDARVCFRGGLVTTIQNNRHLGP